MRRLSIAILLLLAAAAPARADIPPSNSCNAVGESCNTAEPDYKSPGVCQKQTCSRTLPGPNGPQTTSYDCNLCMPAAKGATAASTTPPAANKKGACSVGEPGDAGAAALFLGAAAVAVAVRRRRAAPRG